ncbi:MULTISPECIES: PqqD family protein [unclassified Streptomyces]|uniref:PqqD family protein n=1 Tax=unclassified Streptomyces TaxID=2593676 RepID=UPI000A86EC8A|nr:MULTISPECIES: PqqD family protein [unclassified Streptomyces]
MLVADSRFGDSRAIEARNLGRFSLGLRLLAEADAPHTQVLLGISELAPGRMLPLLGDPVLRNAFEADLATLEHAIARPFVLGELLAQVVDEPGDLGPCARMATPLVRPWPETGPAWVWTELIQEPGLPGDLAVRLRRLYDAGVEAESFSAPVVPSAEMCRQLERGADLLTRLLPQVGPSALRHVQLVGLTRATSADGPLNSMSGGDPLPATILMSPERLSDPWKAAETLLHEGLHLKFFDILRTCSLITNVDQEVRIPWRVAPWALKRVMAALHVYVHMPLFQVAARQAGPDIRAVFGDPSEGDDVDEVTPGTEAALNGTYATPLDRAFFLAGQVADLSDSHLTPDGRRFAGWLLDALTALRGGADGDRSRRPGVPPTPAPRPVFHRTLVLRRTDNTLAQPLPDYGQLLLANTDTAAFHWLNARSWLIYSLCDGRRDVGEVTSVYAQRTGVDAGTAPAHVAAGMAELGAAGLLH